MIGDVFCQVKVEDTRFIEKTCISRPVLIQAAAARFIMEFSANGGSSPGFIYF